MVEFLSVELSLITALHVQRRSISQSLDICQSLPMLSAQPLHTWLMNRLFRTARLEVLLARCVRGICRLADSEKREMAAHIQRGEDGGN